MITDYYTQDITIQRPTRASNGMGGSIETWVDNLVIKGYIDTISGKESKIGGAYIEDGTHVLLCKAGYDIKLSDRINITDGIYRFISPEDKIFDHHAEFILQKIGVDN